jgi:hypothetical protein
MKGRWLKFVVAANLIALLVLAFIYPHLMVSPGALVQGHAELATDCFACHAPWRGAASDRCVSCHAPADIGLRTTQGVAVVQGVPASAPVTLRPTRAAFHQQLIEQDCMACHSDHAGPQLTQRSRKPFSHSLLLAGVRDRCDSCHVRPTDRLHPNLTAPCGTCHTADRWKPATFKHSLLAPAVLNNCQSCHQAPTDALHRQLQGNCQQCHSPERWKPASFEHQKYFVLDRDHDTDCVTCHLGNEFGRYTCYGCHEHTPAKIRAEHEKEVIRDYENCVKCHRSASKEHKGRGEGKHSGKGRERD